MENWQSLRAKLLAGAELLEAEALALAVIDDTAALAAVAGQLRDCGHGNVVTYSRKVFIPLTQLCRVSQLLRDIGRQRLLDLLGAHSVQVCAIRQVVHDRLQFHAIGFLEHADYFFVGCGHSSLHDVYIV